VFEHRTCLYFLAYGMGGGVSAPLPSTTPSRMRERLLISLHNASNSSSTSIDEILEGLVSLGREKTVAAANEVKSFVEETDGIVEFDVLKWSIEDKFGVEFGSGDDQLNTYLKSLSLSADNNASDCLIIKGGRTYVDVQRLFANIGQPFSPLPRDAGDVCSAVWRGDENEDKAEENTHDEGESLKNDRDDDNIDDKDEDDDGEVDNAFTDLSHLLKIQTLKPTGSRCTITLPSEIIRRASCWFLLARTFFTGTCMGKRREILRRSLDIQQSPSFCRQMTDQSKWRGDQY